MDGFNEALEAFEADASSSTQSTAPASLVLSIASTVIGKRDPQLVVENWSRLADLSGFLGSDDHWKAAKISLDRGHRWEALRRVVVSAYTQTDERLRPDLHSALMLFAHLETDDLSAA